MLRIAGAVTASVVIGILLIVERWRARWRGYPVSNDDDFMGD